MPSLPANIRRAAEQNTLALPFRIPPGREWFTLAECGAALGIAESTAEKLYDRGDLTGHSHNAGAGIRQHKRVLRSALVAYAIRTADYTDESLADALIACLPNLPASTLLQVAAQAQALAFQARAAATPAQAS